MPRTGRPRAFNLDEAVIGRFIRKDSCCHYPADEGMGSDMNYFFHTLPL